MSFISDCEALRDARYGQFGHFHDCATPQFLAQALPEFFMELAAGSIMSPSSPFSGFAGDEANFRYDTSVLNWSSDNNAEPDPEHAEGVYTSFWDLWEADGEITNDGDPFAPVPGEWNDVDIYQDKETEERTEFWNIAKGNPPPILTVVNIKKTKRWNRVFPMDLMDWCKSKGIDYTYPEFQYRTPFLPVFNAIDIDNDSAGGMTEQWANNALAGLTRAKVRFGIKGLKNFDAARTVTFKARVWTINESLEMVDTIGTFSATISAAHPTERDTWVTPWYEVDLPGEAYGGEWDEMDSPMYSGLGLPWIETTSGFKPKYAF
ncbi:MAG TPA: hypothetical protein PLU30_23660 [Verrucomicrobiae bacterium]|nr:hypothetical protein [Verrucomicrobiae bacterium]